MKPEELKKRRLALGMSQASLGRELGVSGISVYRWEKGMRSIPPFLHLALRWLEWQSKGGETARCEGEIKPGG
jgi:transcriptional regulator with XRE-family HTH domain